ncbi:outer membrane protein [Aureimonas pseudogalii]|uniref:Opacity protein-like surface antigen n=1 Tax=Aureimonas pseudogalii TaxID=1744844 RepID=A0A7W6EE07_9HYPH|nr:outer membrane beta-barrel protein [Aureimonas pseudogalii]MBB3996930.1 opacity protein-like surface antigen [Aureimonas pseudogalii]
MPSILRPAAALLSLLATASLAAAADIQSAPEISVSAAPARFYVRADLAYDLRSDLDLSGSVATPAGSVPAGLGMGHVDEGLAGGLGLGFQAVDWLRADATVRYSEPDVDFSVPVLCLSAALCGASRAPGEVRAVELMGNVYADLGTVAGFTPYLGGGLGAVHLSYGDGAFDLGGAGAAPVAGQQSWRFAYALSAGVAYDVTPAMALDLGYRYLDVEGGEASSFAVPTPGLTGFETSGHDDGFDRHSIQIGLRYRFG